MSVTALEYIELVRPKTLTASIGPVLIGLALAGIDAVQDKPLIAVLVLLCAVLMQIATNLVNDYYDAKNNVDGEDRLGPKRIHSNSRIKLQNIKSSYRIAMILSGLIGFYLVYDGGIPILVIGISSLVFAYMYTGGPFPLSYIGLGEVLALTFFGPVAVWGTWYLITGEYALLPAVVGLGPGAISWCLMGINNMRDRNTDKKVGKKTLATMVGEDRSRIIPLLGLAVSLFVPIYLAIHFSSPLILLTLLTPLPFVTTWSRVSKGPIDKLQNASLADTGKYLFLYSLILSITLL